MSNTDKPLCHICHTPTDFLMNKDGFDEYICRTCSLSFVHPQPEAEWLRDKVYSAESGYQGNKGSNLKIPISPRYKKTIDYILQKKKTGTLLDVGCSSGQFMFWAKERGFECKGVEINKRTAEIARANGFEVHNGFLDSAPFEKNSFDVVYLGDVIEHVNNPRALVNEAESFLKDGGLFVFSTPNMDCFWSDTTLLMYRLFRIPWAAVTPPHHLFQFSIGNLSRLLNENGFNVTHAEFVSPSSLKYELGSLHLYKRYKAHKTPTNFLFMIFSFAIYTIIYYLNLLITPFGTKGFQMAVFYEKRSI